MAKIINVTISREEKRIVKLMSDGLTVDEIALQLDVNARTLERKVSDLRKLCKCISLPHLVGFFFRNKLIK